MVLLLSVLTLINMVESVAYIGRVTSYKRLYEGDYIYSMNGNAFLALQGDGNLCLRYTTNGELIWTSYTNGNDGCELVVHTNGDVLMYCNGNFKWHSNTVRNVDDGPFTLTVHNEGYATLHDNTGNVYWYAGEDCSYKEWNQIQGSYKHVSVATDGTVWSVDNTNTILRLESLSFNNVPAWTSFDGNNWKMVDVGKSNPIGNAEENLIFAVEDKSHSTLYRLIYRSGSSSNRWHNEGLSPYGPGYSHVSVAADNTVWMIDTNKRVYRRDSGHTPAIQYGQYLDYVSVASSTQIWGVLLVNGVIYERDTAANIWINHGNAPNNEKFTYVSVAEDGTVFAITENDKIYNYQGDMWERVCGSLKQVSVSSINEAWGVDANGNMLYFRN